MNKDIIELISKYFESKGFFVVRTYKTSFFESIVVSNKSQSFCISLSISELDNPAQEPFRKPKRKKMESDLEWA